MNITVSDALSLIVLQYCYQGSFGRLARDEVEDIGVPPFAGPLAGGRHAKSGVVMGGSYQC